MSNYRKQYLLTPGPTMIPPAVIEARAKQLPHHRTPQFMKLMTRIHEELKYLFQTKNNVYTISASGSGAMEASVASLLSPGDTALVINSGKFGQRWMELCKTFGIKVCELHVESGHAVNPSELQKLLQAHPEVKAVFAQLVETSTGVTHPIEALGKIVAATPASFVVDCISGLCAEKLLTDEWHIDIAIGGSQKGTMLPPGLSFLSVSDKAWAQIEQCKNSSYYFDLKRYRKGHATSDHPFTPAISLYIEMDEVLKMIRSEGIENLWKRHAWLANATRAGVAALGFETFSIAPSNTLTAVKAAPGLDVSKLLKLMRDDLGVTLTNGQSELKDKIFRIAHLGYVDRFDILVAFSALEIALKRLGSPVTLGKSILAVEEQLLNDPN